VECRPADHFPADDTGYGFDNIGDVLSVSPLHFEKYLAAAHEVAEELMRLDAPPRVGIELTADKLLSFAGSPEDRDRVMLLGSPSDEVGTLVRVPVQSIYRVLSRAAAVIDREQRLAPLQILCDGVPIGELHPTTQWAKCRARSRRSAS
jgi:hypothetical protein